MGLRSYLRGDDLTDERRSLTPQTVRPSYLPYSPYSTTTALTGSVPLAVTESNALRVSDAWACVRALSDSVASLPVHAYRRTSSGRVQVGNEARAVQLINRPSPGATACDLFGTAMVHLLVSGNAFVGKYRSDGEIVQLGLIDPRMVEVELRGQRVVYAVTLNGERSEYGLEDILHIRGMSSDGLRGLSPVTQCRVALGLSASLQQSAKQFFEEGSRPSGILTAPLGVSDDGLKRLQESWRAGHEGVQKMHRIAVLEGDAKFEPIAFQRG